MFNFALYSNKREGKLVTPVLIDLEENDNRRKVLGIHTDGDEKIQLWKRWGDPYDSPMIINGEQDNNIITEITPFSNALATIYPRGTKVIFIIMDVRLWERLADKIKCSHILVKKQSEATAILERIKKGESFANLARELSIDRGSAKRGGDLGLFGRGVMVKEFEEAAFKLNKGEITPNPIKTEFGYHIVKRAG